MSPRRALLLGGLVATAFIAAACSLVDLSGFSSSATPANDAGALERDAPANASETDAGHSDATIDPDPYGSVVRADAPVAWYRFEENAGASTAKDEIAGRDARVLGGNMGFGAAGIAGRGLACDGTGTGFDVGDVFDFSGKVPFSLELWLAPKRQPAVDQRLFHKRDESADPFRGYILYIDRGDDTVQFEAWGPSLSAWTDAPLPSTGFTHVVATISYATGKGNAKVWIDGKAQGHGGFDNVIDMLDTPQPLRLLERYEGAVDELAIYDKALTEDRILEHHRVGKR